MQIPALRRQIGAVLPRYFQLQGLSRLPRNATIWHVKEAIGRSGAFLTNATMFSNVAITITLEVEADRLRALWGALETTGLQLFDESVAELAKLCESIGPEGLSDHELAGTLHITFVHNEPDLEIDVPAVPV